MEPLRAVRTAVGRQWKRALVVVLVLAVLAAAGTAFYFSQGFHGSDASIEQVRENENVTAERSSGGYVLSPAGTQSPESALVFYPGGRVEPDAYLATFAPVVERSGVTVYVPDMPLNVGLLGIGTAGGIKQANPAVDHWYVGGHSLGGVAACRYAANNPATVDGLALFASYCDQDLSGQELTALSVTGSRDTVLDRDAYADARGRLPTDAQFREIDGVNHSQFGSYRGQRGDQPATVSYETAHDRIATVVSSWLAANSEGRGR